MLVLETQSVRVDQFLSDPKLILVVSEFASAEVASAISRLVRMRIMAAEEARTRLTDFDIWRESQTRIADIEGSDVRLAGAFVRRFDLMLKAPDAIHLALCSRLNVQLVTLDRRLALAGEQLNLPVILIGANLDASPAPL